MKRPSLFLVWMTTVLSDFQSVYGFMSGNTRIAGRGQYHRSSSNIFPRTNDGTRLNLSNDTNASESSASDDNNRKETHTMEHDLNQEIHKRSQQWQQTSTDNNKEDKIRHSEIPMPATCGTISSIKVRQQERELLRELLDGDDAVAKLRQLWYGERGPKMAAPLALANACIGKGPTTPDDDLEDDNNDNDNWTKAERMLLELIEQDATFLEPFVRLSKLYTLQGRFADSQQICLALHAQRPWHYVVLETMVVNTMVLEHNEELKTWASKRLPPPSLKEERLAWVKQAIADSIRLEEESAMEHRKQVKELEHNTEQVARKDDDDRLDWQ